MNLPLFCIFFFSFAYSIFILQILHRPIAGKFWLIIILPSFYKTGKQTRKEKFSFRLMIMLYLSPLSTNKNLFLSFSSSLHFFIFEEPIPVKAYEIVYFNMLPIYIVSEIIFQGNVLPKRCHKTVCALLYFHKIPIKHYLSIRSS